MMGVVEIIGIDHIYIAVSDRKRSEEFYDRVFLSLGFRKNTFAIDGDPHVQYYNRHFGYVLRPARTIRGHDAYSPGLHHLCLRVDSVADVHLAARLLAKSGVTVSEPKLYSEYAPDYVAFSFSDPDNLRLEITNYRAERRARHDHWND
jgi:glyoxylase I family protein